ncbi:MAG: acyl-CoA dehydrogenase family protein [Bryobacteraceae bacterium]
MTFDRYTVIEKLGRPFGGRAAAHDAEDRFVSQNFAELKGEKAFSAMVPVELGGGGLPYRQMCEFIRELARHCPSTALAFSMHQHLVAAALWNHRHGNPGEKLLRRVADGELVLVSTGATDWLGSTGTLEPCDGGFRFSARKRFASGCPSGDLLITSGRYRDPNDGWQVLHFPLSMRSEGVQIEDDWKTMGMRGTGSNTVVLDNVFVPADAVSLRRPMGKFHGVWNIVLGVALPLIGAVYIGVAEASAKIAREFASRRRDDLTAILVGEMENDRTTAQLAFESIVAMANDLDFTPSLENTSAVLIRRTLLGQAVVGTASKAIEVTGGAGYFRQPGLERLLRDALASQFHPLPPKKQQRFTGRVSMGLDVEETVQQVMEVVDAPEPIRYRSAAG